MQRRLSAIGKFWHVRGVGKTQRVVMRQSAEAFGKNLVCLLAQFALPEAFLSVLTQNGEVCSVKASGCGPCMRFLHGPI